MNSRLRTLPARPSLAAWAALALTLIDSETEYGGAEDSVMGKHRHRCLGAAVEALRGGVHTAAKRLDRQDTALRLSRT